MLFFSRWKITFILGAVLFGLLFALPNAVPADVRAKLPSPMQRTLNLGLDLQGGAHMLLEVDLTSVLEQALDNERENVRQGFSDAGRIRTEFIRVENNAVVGRLRDAADMTKALEVLRSQSQLVDPGGLSQDRTTLVEQNGDKGFRVSITQANIEEIQRRTIAQSIEVLRKRIDPTGTTEMTLAREGDSRILLQVPGAKNIDEIKSRINKTANLSFHLVRKDSENAAALRAAIDGRLPPGAAYFPMEDGSTGLIVDKRTRITGECLKSSSEGLHPTGNYPIVNFSFNIRCATLFGDLTLKNIGQRFAVVLDNEIITAPNIQSAIPSGNGFIEGSFTIDSARELSLLLNAGALPAKLIIVEERTVGPGLGQDSINAGKIASFIGLAGVAVFMWLSYGLRFGTIANIALTVNIILIAAALSLFGSTLTLPGIAGIILTIGMAVDANVLIFERIREESYIGRPPVNAIETGYRRSVAPILDANITTLIAAVTLYFVGSGPIRGFAVTLAIGIIMSVFTAVVFARLLTATWLRRSRPKTLPI
ncbi:preprotein translocase subunit SecD [Litorimonas taeanensis]|uniref:Protein translocase subunit SecD n=1 Tax=Litorimonas taeanensis TaxID=568099 RepID=A0A420WKU3_9PROT|nr:protein translocase subunit SecD [Litorimonas taeanensis]RKQ71532.1 preprotein translocase subunit SecD [Litorimonas taeanensis]